MEFLGKSFHYKQLKNKGIEIQMDGSALPDQIVYTPGDHTFTVIAGKEIYSKKISVSYSVKDTLIKKTQEDIQRMEKLYLMRPLQQLIR